MSDGKDRVAATIHLSKNDALAELDALKFAFSSTIVLTRPGSNERELAENVHKGINVRIDYLHDSLRRLLAGE